MRKILLSVLAMAVLLGATSFGFAQSEMKPLVTVSFAGYDRLKADIGVIGRLGGNPSLADGLEMMLKMMTQGKGLAGLDAKQPWGAVQFTNGGMDRTTYGFLPVTDLAQLIEVAKAIPKVTAITKNNDVYEIQAGGPPLYIQQKGQWAIIAAASKDLANAPADPLKLLGDLPKNYGLAVRFAIKNVPEQLRQQFLMQLQLATSTQMMQRPGESDAQYAGRKLGTQGALQAFTALANDLDEVLLGWNIDASTNTTYLDFELTAKAGTKLADQFAQIKPGKSKFAGLRMPEAAVTVIKTIERIERADADVAWAKDLMAVMHKSFLAEMENQGLSEDQLKLAKEMADDVLDVLQKTIESKKSDGGLAVLMEPGAATVVFGAEVVNGGKLEGVLKKLVEADSDAAKMIKLNADTHEGVRLHTITPPMNDPRLVPIVGDKPEMVIGIADDKLLVAAGHDAVKTLKKVLDASKAGADKEVPPLEIKLAVGKIAKFATEMAKDNAPPEAQMKMSMLTSVLVKAGDKDHVTITASPISQGVRVRVEMEEGLVKAIASMGQMMGPMGAMPQGMPAKPAKPAEPDKPAGGFHSK